MELHTPSDLILVKKSFNLAITAALTHGSAVDTLYARRAYAVFTSTPSGASTTSDCYLEESDTSGGSYTKVTGSDFTQATTVGGAQIQMLNIDLAKRKRFLKLAHTGAGGSAAGVACGNIHLVQEGRNPVSQDVTPVSV